MAHLQQERTGAQTGPHLAWNSWMVPGTSREITFYPMDVDPQTGRSIGRNVERTHDSWLREYGDWLRKTYHIEPPSDDDFVGSSVINAGWIRKAGFDRYLTYTISPQDPGRSLRRVRDNLWDHLSLAKVRRMDLDQIPVVITVLRTPTDMPTVVEFTLRDFEEEEGDIGRLVQSYQALRHVGMPEGGVANQTYNRPPARRMADLAAEMERLGHHDIADAAERIIVLLARSTDPRQRRT